MGRVKHLWLADQERGWTSFDCKYVCVDCFEDDAIRQLIRDNAEEHECSYCGQSSEDKPIAADLNGVMEAIYFGICQEWGDPSSEGVSWESAEGGWQGGVIDSWELLRDHLELGIQNDDLFQDVFASIGDKEWCQRNFYRLLPQKQLAFDWHHFSEVIKHKSRFFFERLESEYEGYEHPHEILGELGGYFSKFQLARTLPPGTVFFRARRHDAAEQPSTIGELGPPPKEIARASNRMSPAGISMFYGAFDPMTAINEVCSDPKDQRPLATCGRFVSIKPMRVIDLSATPKRVPSLFDRQNVAHRPAIIFLREFMKDFTAPVEKDGREHIEYVPTQVVTEYIRHIYRGDDGHGFHGVIYPSAVSQGISCVLFVEGAAAGDFAHLDQRSVDKWLELDSAGTSTQKV